MKNCTTKFTNNDDPAHCFVKLTSRVHCSFNYQADFNGAIQWKTIEENQFLHYKHWSKEQHKQKSISKPASAQLIGTSIYLRYLISQFLWHSILCGFIITISMGKININKRVLIFAI